MSAEVTTPTGRWLMKLLRAVPRGKSLTDEQRRTVDLIEKVIPKIEAEAQALDEERLGRALLAAVPGYRRWLEWPVLTTHESQSRVDAVDAEVYAHAAAIARWYADHE